MKSGSILWPGMAAAATLGALALWAWGGGTPALAQPNPRPQACVCSTGVSLTGGNGAAQISHCQCGILACAVVVPSGQLQCAR